MTRSASSDSNGPWALFLDFDGTLVEIVERPDAVAVDPSLPDILTALRSRLDGALAIISGRPIAFLDERFGPHRFDIAGLHGLEHRIGGRLFSCDPEDHPRLRDAVGRFAETFGPKPGILIEDKGCSVAIHWRLAPQERDFVHATVHAALEALGSEYRVQFGKAVAEVLPAAAGKGKVIETFLHQAPYRGRRPVFVGDDVTDESVFAAMPQLGGESFSVGRSFAGVPHVFAEPADVRRALARLAGL